MIYGTPELRKFEARVRAWKQKDADLKALKISTKQRALLGSTVDDMVVGYPVVKRDTHSIYILFECYCAKTNSIHRFTYNQITKYGACKVNG